LFSIRNIDWDAATYDIYLDGNLIKTGADMTTSASYANEVRFINTIATSSYYLDNVHVLANQTITDWQPTPGTLVTDSTYYKDLAGLSPATDYVLETQAQNDAGEGAWSASGYFRTIIVKLLADTVAISDSFAKVSSYIRGLADTVTIADTPTKAIGLVKADSLSIADAIVKTLNLIKAESIAIADSVLKTIGLKKSESVSISDVPSKAVSLIKTEAVAIGDSVAKTVGLNKADTVTIGDTIAKLISLVKADAVAIADTFSRTVSYALSLADNVGITDSIRKTISIVRTDALPIIDSMVSSMGAVLTIVLFDIVTITDRLVGELRTKAYLKQAIARMQVKGMNVARMQVKRMNIAKTHLFR